MNNSRINRDRKNDLILQMDVEGLNKYKSNS